MEVCESGAEQPPLLHWDRKLSELCEPADPDTLLSRTVRRGGGGRRLPAAPGGLGRNGWDAAVGGRVPGAVAGFLGLPVGGGVPVGARLGTGRVWPTGASRAPCRDCHPSGAARSRVEVSSRKPRRRRVSTPPPPRPAAVSGNRSAAAPAPSVAASPARPGLPLRPRRCRSARAALRESPAASSSKTSLSLLRPAPQAQKGSDTSFGGFVVYFLAGIPVFWLAQNA